MGSGGFPLDLHGPHRHARPRDPGSRVDQGRAWGARNTRRDYQLRLEADPNCRGSRYGSQSLPLTRSRICQSAHRNCALEPTWVVHSVATMW